jgi:hypothetical protein
MLDPSLQAVLRSGRDHFNSLFAVARHQYPDLDAEVFKEFLVASVEPMTVAVEAAVPDRTGAVVQAAYEVGLDLLGQRLIGRGARHGFIEAGWQRVLPRYPRLLAQHPFELLAATSNALHQIAATPGARPELWIARLAELADGVPDLERWRRVGQLVSWRAGLAHFRLGALEAAVSLGEALARAALGVPPEGGDWNTLRTRLAADPWFDPSASQAPEVHWVGGFRGFGGLFPEPPRVTRIGGHTLVQSGGGAWLLTADVFGATFHRATAEEVAAAPAPVLPDEVGMKGTRLVFRGRPLGVELRGEPTSAVVDATTGFLTCALTHQVAVFSARRLG